MSPATSGQQAPHSVTFSACLLLITLRSKCVINEQLTLMKSKLQCPEVATSPIMTALQCSSHDCHDVLAVLPETPSHDAFAPGALVSQGLAFHVLPYYNNKSEYHSNLSLALLVICVQAVKAAGQKVAQLETANAELRVSTRQLQQVPPRSPSKNALSVPASHAAASWLVALAVR